MATTHRIGRRIFLRDMGRGAFAVAVLGPTALAACGDSDGASDPTTSTRSEGGGGTPRDEAAALTWERVALGFVSAYVLVRGDRAAVVDTGNPGSEGPILAALETTGLGWGAVDHVILTHAHPDHVGSISAVLDAAPDAMGYAGAADLDQIAASRDLTAVDDGDAVFGLDIIGTPGHTPGHVSVFDEATGLLVAGDALVSEDGALAGPRPDFTADLDEATRSVAKMAALDVDTVLVGHGDPVESGAAGLDALVAG